MYMHRICTPFVCLCWPSHLHLHQLPRLVDCRKLPPAVYWGSRHWQSYQPAAALQTLSFPQNHKRFHDPRGRFLKQRWHVSMVQSSETVYNAVHEMHYSTLHMLASSCMVRFFAACAVNMLCHFLQVTAQNLLAHTS